jgi:hypothetical protein
VIQYNRFVSDISINDIFKYFGCSNISYYKKFRINISELSNILDFYKNLKEEDKDCFINNIKNIIDKKIKRDFEIADDFLN